ncbi:hypothetical protein PSENEW3_00001579 [Picochlorum sp. SENEW3]|nr:hypothetical protein PSENEW3_00001579 [Picochlorum sp. SENEW3]
MGIVSYGDTTRMRKFVRKLAANKPVTVTLVGGSITWGQGASDRKKTSWGGLFFTWINTTYPHANHILVNAAVPGTPSSYMALCWRFYIPRDPDLIIVEYNVNDGGDKSNDSPMRRAHERLLRSLLSLESKPAVIENVVMRIPEETIPEPRYKNAGGDDQIGTLAQYYHLPWISTRSLMWASMYHAEKAKRINYTDWMADRDHPNDTGHRYIANLLIALVQRTPATVWAGDEKSLAEPLHLPLYANNFETINNTCIVMGEFMKHVTTSKGFEWKNEGTQQKQKYGLIGMQPDAYFHFLLNTAENIEYNTRGDFSKVSIAYLASYEHMGMFEVRCISGCRCENLVVDGHKKEHNSQLFTAALDVSKSDSCLLKFRVLNSTSSGAWKVKVAGVILSPEHDDPSASMYFAVEHHGISNE